MAGCLGTSRGIINFLQSKVCLLSMISQRSCWSSLTHHREPPFSSPRAENVRDPDANFCDKATRYSSRRFESVEAEKQLNSPDDVDHYQVRHECELPFFKFRYIRFF